MVQSFGLACVWLAAMLLAPAASAQVYKCRQDGSVVFSDKPCPGGGGQALAVPTSGPQGGIHFEVLTRHYRVTAPTLRQAHMTMKASNPGGFAGWARWKVDYKYAQNEAGGRCNLTRVTVHVVGDILMPEWAEERQASLEEQAGWRAMYSALKRHEDGHIQNGREFAVLLNERLLGMGALPCGELESRARQEYALLYGNLQKRDQEYDTRTDHGLRQDNPR